MEVAQLINSKEAEQLVIGTLLTERDSIDQCSNMLSEDCFYDGVNKAVFTAIMKVYDKGERPDTVSVYRQLQADGVSVTPYEVSLLATRHTFDIQQHARYLHDLSIRRKFFEIAAMLNENSVSEKDDLDEVIQTANAMLSGLETVQEDKIKRMNDGLELVYSTMCANMMDEKSQTGKLTGFDKFDSRTGGLQKSDFVVIAGETSQGKTSFALSIVHNLAKNGEKAAIYSLEMNMLQICARMTAMESGISSRDIMYSKLDNERFEIVSNGIGKLQDAEVYIDESSTSNISTILYSMRHLKKKYGVEVFVIDYLQLVSAPALRGNKEQQTAYIARELKNIAKELDVTVIALSQLSRNRDNPEPSLSRLRDSGQIEEAADVVMFVYRPAHYKRSFPEPFDAHETEGYAMIKVGKGRNIGVFSFICSFDAPTTHFYDEDDKSITTEKKMQYNKKDMPF